MHCEPGFSTVCADLFVVRFIFQLKPPSPFHCLARHRDLLSTETAAVTFDLPGTIASGTATLAGAGCSAPTGSGGTTGAIVIRNSQGATVTSGYCGNTYIGGLNYGSSTPNTQVGRTRYARIITDAPTDATPKVKVFLSTGELGRVGPMLFIVMLSSLSRRFARQLQHS